MALHVLVTFALASLTAFVGYSILCSALTTARAEMLQSYIRVRAEREQTLFEQAEDYITAAEAAFLRRLDLISDEMVEREFDTVFPAPGDGTRRSAPVLFDGTTAPDGDHVFGIGAFLGDGEEMTLEEKRRYLAGYHVVRSVGEAYLGTFSSLYYFTPDRRMVMFAPERPDRLEFYRFDAPADFQLEADEDPRLFNRATNPRGEMQCTPLSRFVYNDGGERSATACRKPVHEGETLLGAFGTSVDMTDHLARALESPPTGGVNMVFDRDRNVIARGEAAGARIDPAATIAVLADDPRASGIVQSPDGRSLIAFSRIQGPAWYFVSVVQLDPVYETASHWAKLLFAFVFSMSLLFAALRGILRRLYPTRRLLRARRLAQASRKAAAARQQPNLPANDPVSD